MLLINKLFYPLGAFEKVFNYARFRLSKKSNFGMFCFGNKYFLLDKLFNYIIFVFWTEFANKIKRFCIICDKTKEYYEIMKMGLRREICRKCKMQLLYQCKNCHGICQDYQKMTWHMLFRCKLRLRFFSVSHKSHLRKILARRYELLKAQ